MSNQNPGKHFEEMIRKSVPEDVYYMRLRDDPAVFQKVASYTHKQPYDCQMFWHEHLFCFELKSTKGKSCSFETDPSESGIIHYHQIKGLEKANQYEGIIPGFLINWRNDELNTQVTYFIHIVDFNKMVSEINKKSFNLIDMLRYGAVLVNSTKLKVNYTYDVHKLLQDLIDKENKERNNE